MEGWVGTHDPRGDTALRAYLGSTQNQQVNLRVITP
jgi:hypothetical protein